MKASGPKPVPRRVVREERLTGTGQLLTEWQGHDGRGQEAGRGKEKSVKNSVSELIVNPDRCRISKPPRFSNKSRKNRLIATKLRKAYFPDFASALQSSVPT